MWGSAQEKVRVTPAQLRVLKELASGATYGAIGQKLFITQATVRSHIESLRRCFGVDSNVGIVLAAVVVGVLSADTWPVELTGITEFSTQDLGSF